jgi:sphingosine kinase
MDKVNRTYVEGWIVKLLDRAYGHAQRQKRIKILINPFGGQGKAQKWYGRDIEPILAAAKCTMDVERTQFKGHAIEIAEKLDLDAFDVVASCSGDGLPHEVFNGLGKRPDARVALSKLAVVQLPCGSGNAMSHSLNGTGSNSMAALCLVKGVRTPMDLTSITQGDTRTLSFLSQSVGIIAETDLGTENLRWLGDARFTIGLIVRLFGKTIYPADLAVDTQLDTKDAIREHYQQEVDSRKSMEDRRREFEPVRALDPNEDQGLPQLRFGTVQDPLPEGWEMKPYDKLGNFFCGNMPMVAAKSRMFPAALPHDGCADLVTIDGDIARMDSFKLLMAVEHGTILRFPFVKYRKIRGYRIAPKNQQTGYIDIDGESMPFAPYQAEVHHGLGTVLTRDGHLYDSVGVGMESAGSS